MDKRLYNLLLIASFKISRVKVNVSNKDPLFTKPHSKQLLRTAHSSKLSNFSYIKTTVNKTKKDSK